MKLVREHIYEKFTEDSDPISDMGIGFDNIFKTDDHSDEIAHPYIKFYVKNYYYDYYLKSGHIYDTTSKIPDSSLDLDNAKEIILKDYFKKESVNEKFTEDGDPIHDMGIGIVGGKYRKKGEHDNIIYKVKSVENGTVYLYHFHKHIYISIEELNNNWVPFESNRLNTVTRRKINKELSELGTYHGSIPLSDIQHLLRNKYNIVLIQEDYTKYDAIFCGEQGYARIEIAYEDTEYEKDKITFYEPIENSLLILTWYKMNSGGYEIVTYLS